MTTDPDQQQLGEPEHEELLDALAVFLRNPLARCSVCLTADLTGAYSTVHVRLGRVAVCAACGVASAPLWWTGPRR